MKDSQLITTRAGNTDVVELHMPGFNDVMFALEFAAIHRGIQYVCAQVSHTTSSKYARSPLNIGEGGDCD